MVMKIDIKSVVKDVSTKWNTNNPKLAKGIIAYEQDTNKIKLFDGINSYNSLPYISGDSSSQTDLSHYLSKAEALATYALKDNLPSKLSDLENDIGYITRVPSEYATKDEMIEITNSMISSVYKFKGSVNKFEDLPETANQGDVYNVNETDCNYAWTGSNWDSLSGMSDLTDYAKTESVNKSIDDVYAFINGSCAMKSELTKKADTSYVDAEIGEINNELSNFNQQLGLKADTSYVDAEIEEINNELSNLNQQLGLKADKSFVIDGLAEKAHITFVTDALNEKADKSELLSFVTQTQLSEEVSNQFANNKYYTKDEIDNGFITTSTLENTVNDLVSKDSLNTTLEVYVNKTSLLSNYYDKTQVDALILNNELVKRVSDLESEVSALKLLVESLTNNS